MFAGLCVGARHLRKADHMGEALLLSDIAESGEDDVSMDSMSPLSMNAKWQAAETTDAMLLSSWWFKLGKKPTW